MPSPPHPNPYQPTPGAAGSIDPGEFKRPTRLLVSATIIAAGLSILAVCAPFIMKDFRQLFEGFGVQAKGLTGLFVHAPWIWSLLALASVYVCVRIWMQPVMSSAQRSRWARALRLCRLAAGIALALAVYALYAPMFALGTVV